MWDKIPWKYKVTLVDIYIGKTGENFDIRFNDHRGCPKFFMEEILYEYWWKWSWLTQIQKLQKDAVNRSA